MMASLAPAPPPRLRPTFNQNARSIRHCILSLRTAPTCCVSNTAVAGGASVDWSQKDKISISNVSSEVLPEESYWRDLDADLQHWTRPLRPVQWYPGHIAKTEKELKDQLKLMDVVIEVRDARIPMATSHPQMDLWLGNRKRILVLNREDMISTADRNAWATFFTKQGIKVVFANGQLGMGTMKLGRLAKTLASGVNIKRRAKGLLPRPVRAGIVGYPNVGKSSLINRLLKRRMCPAAPRPGVTRELKWVHFGKDLKLLDSPGILPMRISDQAAAIKLAICDDIGERSYDVADVAAILVQMLSKLPTVGMSFVVLDFLLEITVKASFFHMQMIVAILKFLCNNFSDWWYRITSLCFEVQKLCTSGTRSMQMDTVVKYIFRSLPYNCSVEMLAKRLSGS